MTSDNFCVLNIVAIMHVCFRALESTPDTGNPPKLSAALLSRALLHGSRGGRIRWWKLRTAAPTRRMPSKHNTKRRHHIPKMKFKVTNWAEYDAGLRRRGSLTLWVTDEVIDGWQASP